MTLELTALVTAKRLPRPVSEKIAAYIASLDGKRVTLTVKEAKRPPSNPQYRYLFGVVIKMIGDAFREHGTEASPDDIFVFLKVNVWKHTKAYFTPDGEVFFGPGSTKEWPPAVMEERLEQARAWAAEVLHIQIPLPGETIYEQPQERN